MRKIELICNMCGKKQENPDLNDFHSFKLSPGYGSQFDCTNLYWDLCDGCLAKLFKQFKYGPDEYNY
jgi:hypothetical protein